MHNLFQAILNNIMHPDPGDSILSVITGAISGIIVSQNWLANLALNCAIWLLAGFVGAMGAILAKNVIKSIINIKHNKKHRKDEK